MPDLEPITREEKLLDGEDLTPITRKEMFIKRIYDKTQEVPEPVTREEMFLKKAGEGSGGDITVESLNVTANGTYQEEGKAYSPVVVNVPTPENSYQLKSLPTGAISTITDGANLPMPSLKIGIEPIQEGSGDPSPENIRPIIGHTEANVTDIDNITNKAYFEGLMNGTYGVVDLGTLNWSYNSSLATFFTTLSNTKTQYNFEGLCCKYVKGSGDKTWNNDTYIGAGYNIYVKDSAYSTADAFKTAMNGVHMIYELATPTTPTVTPSEINELYEEFGINGQTYTIDLDGTRYGCTLDVVSGELVVDRVEVDLGSLSWSVIGAQNSIFGATVNGLKTYSYGVTPDMLCSIYKVTPSSYNDPYISANGIIWTYVGVSAIRIKDTAYSDATAFKTAMNGVQLVYELATPQTIQLTPTAVKSLLGTNNIWADTGDVLEGSYFKSI